MSTAKKLLQESQDRLPANSPVPNRRILVVDDEPAIGDGIRRILTPVAVGGPVSQARSSRSLKVVPFAPVANEFEIVVVDNPEAALNEIRQSVADGKPFAMGFFDVMLGTKMDGIELVREAFKLDPRLFAVFVTAYQDRSVDTIGQVVGEENREKWDYINKPFTDGEILQKARNASSLWDLHRLKEWQAERLDEAHQLLLQHERQSTVAAVGRSVAHEFGNLLTHIVGNAELALEQGGEPAMKNALDLILKASDTAANILKRFRRLHGSAESASKATMVDVGKVLSEAVELVEFQFSKRAVQVQKPAQVPALVLGHHHSLVQVFVNLFMNALYVMPGGGTLTITLAESPDKVEIKVRDSGPGIPEDILPRVTQALFTTKGSEGTGLGLSIVKEIVEIEHGGTLIVGNHPQGGAEIKIELPPLGKAAKAKG